MADIPEKAVELALKEAETFMLMAFKRMRAAHIGCADMATQFEEWLRVRAALAAAPEMVPGCPDDIRAKGWAVAVHNDYQLNGEAHTFWLFTRGNRCIKGEGRTDAEALNIVRAALNTPDAT